MSALTASILRELMHYDPETGVFTRKVRTAQRHQVGDRADFPAHGNLRGYRMIGYKQEKILAHRAAWLYTHGAWPEKFIDHINGDKSDNRIANLRQADPRLNGENQKTATVRNQSGFLGVTRHMGKWYARIYCNGKAKWLGWADTPEAAYQIYLRAKRQLHQGCTI